MKKLFFTIIWLITLVSQAQSPQLLKDINTTHSGDGQPLETVTFGSYVYFIKDDGINGSEVWRTDGSTTEVFTDIDNDVNGDPYSLTVWNGKLYFSTSIMGVWESDGTIPGTTSFTSATGDIIPANTVLYLANESSKTLYVTDPSVGGELALYTLNFGSSLRQYTVLGDGIFFVDNVPDSGNEVVYSDGTVAGTLIIDIYPGADGSWPGAFTAYDGKMYFYALKETPPFGTNNNGTGGKALYESDGSVIGTTELVDFGVFSGLSSRISSSIEMTVFNNELYYYDVTGPTNTYDNTELYTFDGTSHTLLHTFVNPNMVDIFKNVRGYKEIGGTLYLNATDNQISGQPRQTDGSTVSVSSLDLDGVTEYEILGSNVLYANATTEKLFSSDLAGNVTEIIDHASTFNSAPSDFSILGSELFYIGSDDVEGIQLWKTDGTNVGTSRVTTSGFVSNQGSNPTEFTVLGSNLLFNATSGANTNVYTTDGTEANTMVGVADMTINEGGVEFNGEYYFSLGTNFNDKLLKTDGATITEIQTFEKTISHLTVAGGKLYFVTNTAAEGTELWVTDGTVDNGAALDLATGGTFSTFPEDLMVVNGELYFTGIDVAGNGTRSLMKSDGTLAGTEVVNGNAYDIEEVAVAGDNIYIVKDDIIIGKELILYNVISEGLIQYDIFDNGSTPNGGSNPKLLTTIGDKMYFFYQFDGSSNLVLAYVDGTNADPVVIRSFGNATYGTVAKTSTFLTFFISTSGGGSRYVVDASNDAIWEASFNVGNNSKLSIDNILYFVSTSDVNQLYETDGTDEGTMQVQSIAINNSVYDLTNFNDDLYFVSDINDLGKEVYSYRSSNQGFSIANPSSMNIAYVVDDPSDLLIDWVSGGGDKRILLASQSGNFSFPEDGVTYTANEAYGGSEISAGSGTYVIANGDLTITDGNSFTPGQTYHFLLIEYNEDTPGDTKYDRLGGVTASIDLPKASQTITFENPGDVLGTDSPYPLGATTTSGLSISYAVNSGPAVLSGGTSLVFTSTGTVTVTASQAGNAEYEAAEDVQVIFDVVKDDQVLTFNPPANLTYPAENVSLSASSSSGLSVDIELLSGPASLNGTDLSVTGAGDIVLRASNGGNDFYNEVSQEETIVVAKGDHTLTINAIADKEYGSIFILGVGPGSDITSSAPAGDPTGLYDINIVSGPATANNESSLQEVTITGVGTVTFEVVNLGNDNWNAAPTVQGTFEAIKASQTVTESVPDEYKFSTEVVDFSTLVTSSTGLPVSLVITDGPGFFSGTNLNEYNFSATGLVTVSAFATSNENYEASPSIEIVFDVLKGDQTVTWNGFTEISTQLPSEVTYSPDGFTMDAEASSGLGLNYAITSGSGAGTISGDKLSITSSGSFNLVAEQTGDENWNAASSEYFVTVNKSEQTISFDPIEDKIRDEVGFSYTAPVSTSGLEVTVVSGTGRTSYDGTTVTFNETASGLEELRFIQSGDENYLPAEQIVSFCISAPSPVLSIVSQSSTEVALASDNAFDDHEYFLNGSSIGVFGSSVTFSEEGIYTAVALATDGCPSSAMSNEVTYEVVLGLERDEQIKVYPNPTTDWLSFSIEHPVKVRVLSMSGKSVYYSNHVSHKVDLSELRGGQYIIQIFDNDDKLLATQKIIKVN